MTPVTTDVNVVVKKNGTALGSNEATDVLNKEDVKEKIKEGGKIQKENS